jgi:hypothetical protein
MKEVRLLSRISIQEVFMPSEKWLKRKVITKSCLQCQSPFETREKRGRFCSQVCSGKYYGKNRQPLSDEHKAKISCSIKTYFAEHPERKVERTRRIAYAANYTKGKHKKPKSLLDLSSRTVSKIFKRLEVGCSRCGWNEAPCDVHHIYGRKVEDANSHDKLTYLCPNCHRLFHHKKIGPNDVLTLTQFIGDRWKDCYYG